MFARPAHPDKVLCGCRGEEEIEADLEAQKAENRKILLEMIGDRPDADAKAPEEYVFVCKLNPVTTEEDLETIFCRYGFQNIVQAAMHLFDILVCSLREPDEVTELSS
jgi:hypothetical protein